ncbi:MAG: succinate dehydrogenase, hydrophobic membrane anchor protein, partial [Steroidobacteraceae bacterium]|nr:succinate dehydrogenase, hydrophobic membrane anchor protein [Steroidobacteraceae bacterium]MDW8259598.1 succinate dehydrogenase, hydrophobic membrane anchor protein [Gammaproteobacteria bacterium]
IHDYAQMRSWLGAGWRPVWMALLVLVAAWHSWLGVQVVIEDYLHRKAVKNAALMLSSFIHGVVAVAAVFAVVKTALIGL